jgi:hypothetical protein
VRSYDFVSDQVGLAFTKRLPGHRSSLVLYDGDNLWSTSDTGNVITIPLGDRVIIDHEEQTSCEQFEAGRYQPSLRQLLYTCISEPDVLDERGILPPIRRVVTIDLITHEVSQPVYQEVGSVERVISVSPSGALLLVANDNSTEVVRVTDGVRFRVTDTRLYNPQWSFDELSIYGVDPVGNGSRWSVVSMSD